MAEIMTFVSLRAEIADALERGQSAVKDPIAYPAIARAINRAERRIAFDVKVQGAQEAVVGTLAADVSVYEKPGNWLRTISVNYATNEAATRRRIIQPRSYEYIRTVYPDGASTGDPRYYADYGLDHWLIGPTPADSAPFEVLYYALPQLLDEANQTNWLTETIPHILLPAALAEFALFLKDNERAGAYLQTYQSGLGSLAKEDVQKITDRASTRRAA